MSTADLGLNILLAVAPAGLVLAFIPDITRRDITAGALAAAGALVVLFLVRLFFPETPAVGTIRSYTGSTAERIIATRVVLNLAALALVEELAKYIAVAPWRELDHRQISPHPVRPQTGKYFIRRELSHRRTTGAIGRGLGFASAEHLLFLLVPVTVFVRRVVFAGGLHMGTALLYARPRALRRRGLTGVAPITDILLILLGTTIHLAYNLTVRGLDLLPLFW